MKKRILSLLLALTMALNLCACGSTAKEASSSAEAPSATEASTEEEVETHEDLGRLFTDDCGRSVAFAADLTAVAPAGNVATMILATLAPERLVCSGATITGEQAQYLPAGLASLPVTGQLYGGKSTLNVEELLATGAEVIIDLGDYKPSVAEDLDALQEQTGIPCIFLQADLVHLADTYRALGELLNCRERGEELASFVEETMSMAAENSAKLPEEERLSVLYSTGADPLGTNAEGSSQAQVLGIVGAVNAVTVEDVTSKGGGNIINMEQVFNFDPNVILVSEDAAYETVTEDPVWQTVSAMAILGRCYQIPAEPYCWMSSPPSVNMLLGIWWLGNLLYPEVYDYDMTAKAQEIYKTLWGYELSAEECSEMLSRSTLALSD